MLTEERLQMIQDMVERRKSASIQELVEELAISESTVRRDLALLDQQGRVSKVRGGAMACDSHYNTEDAPVASRRDLNLGEKQAIARYAASLIQPHDFIFLDAGTTTELIIDYLAERNVVFVTNALTHARKLSQLGYTAYIPGGEFKAATEAVVGEEAVESLRKYNFTKGFWGTNGVSLEGGFGTPDVKEAVIKKTAMEHCAERYVLCDSSKFSQISCVKFNEIANAVIITTELTKEILGGGYYDYETAGDIRLAGTAGLRLH